MELRGRKKDLEKLIAGHLHYYRPFEMKAIVKEGEFINKQGIYLLFEGQCGIYRKSPRLNELSAEEMKRERAAGRITEHGTLFKKANVGTTVGVESHLYGPDCTSCFTAVTNEKTKLLFIDAEGFEKYLKQDLLMHYDSVFEFYRKQPFIKNSNCSFKDLLPLIMSTKYKSVLDETIIVEQDDPCKFIYFVKNGSF